MKITTIDKREIDTNKMPDIEAEMVEMIEKSGIREFAMKHNGICYAFVNVPNQKGWSTMHIDSAEKYYYFLNVINNFVVQVSGGKEKLAIVPNTAD
jgi:hypothetical protein